MKTNKKITIISSAIAVIFFIIALCCFGSGCTAPLEGNTVASSSVSTTITTPKANVTVSTLASTGTTLATETFSNEISTTKKATTSTTILETTITTTTTTVPTTTTTTILTTTKIKEETTTVPTTIKSNEDIALEVIRGNYGVIPERKVLLEKEGYVYEDVQAIVNKMMDEINSEKMTTTVEQTTTIETTTSTVKTEEVTSISTDSTSMSTETTQSATTTESTIVSTNNIFTDYEYNLLCKLIANEYGGKSSVVERAKIVAAVVNQTTRYGDSIETCIYRSCVPWGFNPNKEYYGGTYYKDMSDAVDYYLNNGTAGFYDIGYWQEGADSWWGDGTWNHFYRA